MARITVEDCLDHLPNRFALVHLSVTRARQLMKDAEPLVQTENKECVTALREVAERKIRIKADTGWMTESADKSAGRKGRKRRSASRV